MEKLVKTKHDNQYEACKSCKYYTDNCISRPNAKSNSFCEAIGGQHYPKTIKQQYYFY